MQPKRIYLATPYSHPDEDVRTRRFMAVSRKAAELMLEGHLVFSPITYGHIIGAFGTLPGDFGFWEAHCLSFLRHWAHELHVLALPGWQESRGVLAETAEADRLGLPIKHLL